jgi:hypothetical protein
VLNTSITGTPMAYRNVIGLPRRGGLASPDKQRKAITGIIADNRNFFQRFFKSSYVIYLKIYSYLDIKKIQ